MVRRVTSDRQSDLPFVSPVRDLKATVAQLVAKSLAEFPGDRYAAAAEMSRLSGICVTKSMLDGYTAECRETFNLPAWMVIALELATGTRYLSAYLIDSVGGKAVYGREIQDAELGRLERQRQQLDEQIKAFKRQSRAS